MVSHFLDYNNMQFQEGPVGPTLMADKTSDFYRSDFKSDHYRSDYKSYGGDYKCDYSPMSWSAWDREAKSVWGTRPKCEEAGGGGTRGHSSVWGTPIKPVFDSHLRGSPLGGVSSNFESPRRGSSVFESPGRGSSVYESPGRGSSVLERRSSVFENPGRGSSVFENPRRGSSSPGGGPKSLANCGPFKGRRSLWVPVSNRTDRSVNGERRSEDDTTFRASEDTTYKASEETIYKVSDDTTYKASDDTRGSDDPTYSTIDERYNSNDSLNQWEETYLQPEEEGHYQDMGGKHIDGVKVEGAKYSMEEVEDSYVTSLEEEGMRDNLPANKQSNNFFSPVNHNLESADDEYISHIRSSSYALLSNANDRRLFCEAKANYSNVQSSLYHPREDQSSLYHSREEQQHFQNYTRLSGNAQSLPYIGHQGLSIAPPVARNQNSNELEEYARKYEAIQRQSSRRTAGTPFIDQLKKESQKTVFWRREEENCGRDSTPSYSPSSCGRDSTPSYSPSFPSSHHTRQSSNSSMKADSPAFTGYHPPPHSLHLPQPCQTPPPPQPLPPQQNGRDSSTSSVMSDSSSETLRYGEPGQGYQSSVNSSKAGSPQQEHSCHTDTPLQSMNRSDHQLHKQNHARTVTKELKNAVATRAKPTKHGSNDARRKSDYFLTSDSSRGYSYPDPTSKNAKNDCESEDFSGSAYHSSLAPPKPTQAQTSVSERISHIEKYGLSTKQTSHPDYHLSKSVPNLVSQNGSEDCGDESADWTDGSDNPPPSNYTYFDPDKTMKVSDNTLKMIQKQALLAYYQRQRTLPKDETKQEENEDETRSSSEAGHNKEYERTFARSISHGSLSNGQFVSQGLGTRTPSQTSLASQRTSKSEIGSAKYGGMLPSHQKIQFPQNCQSIPRNGDLERCPSSEESSRLQAWKTKKEPMPSPVRSMAIPPLLPSRNPTPDPPPPPPPEGLGEFVCSDEPLPPPPLRIEEDVRSSSSLTPELELLKKSVPKRNSPATIAAKEAPGWDKFLGGNTSTIAAKEAPGWDKFLGGNTSNISFTSDVARKFRRTKDKMRNKAREPKSLPYDLTSAGLKPLHAAKSSPSLHERGLEPSMWWKTSMDSLRTSSSGDYYPPGSSRNNNNIKETIKETTVSHSHSNSDSGLSSLSGRTSCMSPMSTVSSVSSASSGSSRASLRSASIVSSSTIPLDEDEEDRALCGGRRSQKEEERRRSMKEDERRRSTSQKEQEKMCDARRSHQEEERVMSGVRKNQSVIFRENLPEEEAVDRLADDLFMHINVSDETRALFGGATGEAKTSSDYLKGVFGPDHEEVKGKQTNNKAGRTEEEQGERGAKEEHTATEVAVKKNELISRISKKLSVLKAEQASLKDETRVNDESGRGLLARIQEAGTTGEVDKYRLHVEEMDKITSLLLGLAGRLAKAEEAWRMAMGKDGEDENKQNLLCGKKKKLEEQLVEAKDLKSSIDRRSVTVCLMIQKYLDLEEFRTYQNFLHIKCQLIVHKRQIGERISISEHQLLAIKNN